MKPVIKKIEEAIKLALQGKQTTIKDSTGQIIMIIGLGKERFETDKDLLEDSLEGSNKISKLSTSWFE